MRVEAGFIATHSLASQSLRPTLRAEGGVDRWPTVRIFLDEMWTRQGHLRSYVDRVWETWELPGRAPYDELIAHDAWRLYFDGWSATVYERQIMHPQRRKVQQSDLVQSVYVGLAASRILATEDTGFREIGSEILDGAFPLARIVPLDEVVA